MDVLLDAGGEWLWALGLLGVAIGLGVGSFMILFRLVRRATQGLEGPTRSALLRRLPGPLRVLLPVLFVYALLPALYGALPGGVGMGLNGLLQILVVGVGAWLLIALLYAGEEAVVEYYTLDTPDNLKARKVVTH